MTRLELHETLVSILGSRNVYFQPPESVKIKYPCIIYRFVDPKVVPANNGLYMRHDGYTIMLVDEDPESIIFDKILALPYVRFETTYTRDNLNHWNFMLYTNHKEESNNGR